MSAEPLIDIMPIMKREDDGAIITQFDYPPLEDLGLHQDGLPGAAQPHDHRGRARQRSKRTAAPRSCIEDLDLDADQATYELLARGDTLGVFQLDGGPMRALLRQMKPDQLRRHLGRHRPVPPGPHGRELAHQLRAAQERPAGDHADPPRARGAARRDPRRHLRPDRLPGAGDGGRAEGRRLHARPGRHPAPRDGQEEEVRARQAVRRLPGRHEGQRLQRRRPSRCSGTS